MSMRDLLGKLARIDESMKSDAKKPTGPKFVGKWKGTDPASAAKDKLVGASESMLKDLEKALNESPKRDLMREFNEYKKLNEFAPGNGGGESGRWYTDDEMTNLVGDGWWQDLDISGNVSKQEMINEAQAWLLDNGYRVQVLNVKVNDDDCEWFIEGSFQNNRFAKKGLNEFAPDDGGESRKFIPWPEFIEQLKQILHKDFAVKEKIIKSTIQARFIPHDPMEFGPTMLYSYYETRAGGRNKGAVSTRGSIQVGKYFGNSDYFKSNNPELANQLLTSFNLLKGHPFERHFDLTFENIYKIANIIQGNTQGAYQMPQQALGEDLEGVEAELVRRAAQYAMIYGQSQHLQSVMSVEEYICKKMGVPLEVAEHIVKHGGGYRILSKKTGKNMGTFPSKSAAEKHEREIQYFKHMGESVQFNSKQEVINHFVKQGKSAAAGAAAWERGWRGTQAKPTNMNNFKFKQPPTKSWQELDEYGGYGPGGTPTADAPPDPAAEQAKLDQQQIQKNTNDLAPTLNAQGAAQPVNKAKFQDVMTKLDANSNTNLNAQDLQQLEPLAVAASKALQNPQTAGQLKQVINKAGQVDTLKQQKVQQAQQKPGTNAPAGQQPQTTTPQPGQTT